MTRSPSFSEGTRHGKSTDTPRFCRARFTPGGRLLVHDFMVNDSLDGPALGALWALQHVTVNADGLGLCPAEIISRMASSGFDASKCESLEMIHGMTKLVVAYK